MRPRNQQLYHSVPKPDDDFRVVSREWLPKKSCYRIAFIDMGNGLLRKRPYNPRDGPFVPFPEWAELQSRKEENEVNVLYASLEGLALTKESGYSWFQEDIFALDKAKEIGKGSESLVHRVNLAGNDCVVKLVNVEGLKKLNEFGSIWRAYFNPPDYFEKFGVTRQISELLSAMQTKRGFTTFEIEKSPLEYVASRHFLVGEYINGTNLKQIREQITKTEMPVVEGREREFWRTWLPIFEEEQKSLEELFFLVGLERCEPFTQIDFNFPNWIVKGFSQNGKVRLSLIDQAPAGVASDISMYTLEQDQEKHRQEELLHKWENDPSLLEYLRQYQL